MPSLIRINISDFPSTEPSDLQIDSGTTSKRERRLFLALSVLTSVNVLVISGIATFTALVFKH